MKRLLIINAVVWAIVIMVASYLYNDSPDYVYLLGVMVVGFTLQNGFTYETFRKQKGI